MSDMKSQVEELRKTFSNSQLAIVLGLSNSAVTSRLSGFRESSFESTIKGILDRIKKGENAREILFEKWSDRFLNNIKGLVCKNLRVNLDIDSITLSDMLWKNKSSASNITSCESGTNIMSNNLFDKIIEKLERLAGRSLDKEIDTIEKKAIKFQLPEQLQIIKFRQFKQKFPSVMKLLIPPKTLNGATDQISVSEKLSKQFDNVFLGVKFIKDLKGSREIDIDVLIVKEDENIGVEIKSWKSIKWNTLNRKLKWTNFKLRTLKSNFQELTKIVCLVPNIRISESWKRRFILSGCILLDEKDMNSDNLNFNFTSEFENKIKDERKVLFEKKFGQLFESKDALVLKFSRKLSKMSLSDVCKILMLDPLKWKTVLAGLESGRIKNSEIKNKLKDLFIKPKFKSLIQSAIEEERKRWITASLFPMAVGLANLKNQDLEIKVENFLQKNNWITVRNALISDKESTFETLNGKFPEADIVAEKSNEFLVVECKDSEQRAKSQLVVELKREIEKLSIWLDAVDFDKAILAVRSSLSKVSLDNLESFAKGKGVELLVVN